MPIWCRLLEHCMRLAASRTFWTAGNSSPMRIAMMAMTTSSSIRVNPGRRGMIILQVFSEKVAIAASLYPKNYNGGKYVRQVNESSSFLHSPSTDGATESRPLDKEDGMRTEPPALV